MKRNPEILIVGQVPPPYHGSNVMAKIMIDTLKNLGYNVFLIDKKFSEKIDQIGQVNLGKIFRIFSLGVQILINIIKKKPSLCIYFIAVGKSAIILDAFYLFILRKFNVPYVLRFGGKGYALLQKQGCLWNKIVKITLSNATGGIVLGQNLKLDVISNIDNTRLIHIPNCVLGPINIKRIQKERNIRVLFLSNLIPTKGVMEVLKAAKIVLTKKEVYFTLAGSFSSKKFEDRIRTFIKYNNIGKYVSLPGLVVGRNKDYLLKISDIFVFPTYYEYETFAIVNVEAMSYGIPVISSSEGAIPEIVQDGISGFIVNPKSPDEIAEKILLLANDSILRKNMGENGRKIFQKKYNLKVYADNIDKAIGQFLKFAQQDKLKKEASKIYFFRRDN